MMTDEPAPFSRLTDTGTAPDRGPRFDRLSTPASHFPPDHAVAAAMAEHPDWPVALERVVRETMTGAVVPPDLVVAFVSGAWAQDYPHLIAELRAATCAATVVGCSVGGAIGSGREAEGVPAISLMAAWLPSATLRPVRLTQEHLAMLDEPGALEYWGDIQRDEVRSWLVFSEPFRFDLQALLDGLTTQFPGVPVLGGVTSRWRE
ncbi:MAG TPA: FIST N-terminal domain-containing protein, partial [Thermomicrobiales bacterium]|nr:FIST N-terminal domain-containing protein [Thermomicrobiales bacterium]